MSRNSSGWTFRSTSPDTGTVSVYIDLTISHRDGIVDADFLITDLDGRISAHSRFAPIVACKDTTSGRVHCASVGNVGASYGGGRTVKAAAENWASQVAGDLAYAIHRARRANLAEDGRVEAEIAAYRAALGL